MTSRAVMVGLFRQRKVGSPTGASANRPHPCCCCSASTTAPCYPMCANHLAIGRASAPVSLYGRDAAFPLERLQMSLPERSSGSGRRRALAVLEWLCQHPEPRHSLKLGGGDGCRQRQQYVARGAARTAQRRACVPVRDSSSDAVEFVRFVVLGPLGSGPWGPHAFDDTICMFRRTRELR